ncbi:Transcription initiation factor IIB protein [Marine Group I thaumarchaeote SCGC AAA799-B03]|uniref:Transcription initiation factor IIB n=3 Tax=Marine Group I TaxID=905826 RepID=A0A087S600_9ARCH|nr:Transcription initiation factor IIB protein [Marine Group I thaumarchaeote SCGC AAA799-N04]KFM19194.1 Transcription initiation factor IIB protein [Marine Group I thaumarchaeote SCGC RSA3]KFM21154.1 Transcription initiation factor IIB protein [Marine Group I thaumarchaeote SCGC AAA799-B03]
MVIQQYATHKRELSSCDQSKLITDFETGEMFCSDCGLVLSERIDDFGPECTIFSPDKINKKRTGDGTSLAKHDQGLSTFISSENKDAFGKPFSFSMKKTLKQLRMQDMRSKTHLPAYRNFIHAFNELNRLKDKLVITNPIVEDAAYIYRKAVERKLVRGRSISSMIAASLYAACRDTKTPRTLNDVSDAANIKRKDIARTYRILYRELELKVPVVDSIQCIARISSKLEISEKIKRKAIEILELSNKYEFSAGKDPMGLAAAALYLSCINNGLNMTQRELAEASNTTQVTIRNRHKDLQEILEFYTELQVT